MDKKDETKEKKCRECGCTDLNSCPGGCSWITDDLCSACDFKVMERD